MKPRRNDLNVPTTLSEWSRRLALRAVTPALATALLCLWCAAPDALARQEQPREPAPTEESREDAQDGSWLRRVWTPRRDDATDEPAEDAQPDPERAQELRTVQSQAQPTRPGARTPAGPPLQTQPAAPRFDNADEEFVIFPAFTEPVEISSLIDWVSNRLQVNILSDPSIAGRMVKFNGPMEVRPDELLDLLSLLVEQQGFALTQERPGWYVIRTAGEVALNLGEGAFTTTRVISTPLLRPSALRAPIDAALAGRPGAGTGRISYVDELGIIIATDTPRGLRAIEGIVEVIIAEQMRQSLHRFEIIHISAELARTKLIELNGGGAVARATPARAAQPGGQQPQQQPTGAGGLSNLGDRLFVDAESNSLIFRGSIEENAQIGALLVVVDVPSRLIARRYPAGPASPAICAYGERRGLGPVTGTQAGAQAGSQQLGFRVQQQTGAQSGASMSGSGFVIEDSNEAFVYFGTESQHAQVQQLVDAFAEHARQARVVVEIYKLRHANAEDVAELLLSLVEDATQDQFGFSPFLPQSGSMRRPVSQAAPVSPGDVDSGAPTGEGAGESISFTPAEQVAITADVSRNQVIIKAPARQQTEFKTIIEKLDVRRPQVYIEAKIVSVTTTDDFTFSVESQFTPGQSVLFTNFGLTTTGEGASATDPRQVRTNLSGLTAAIIKSDYVPIVINALQRVGDTRIVSNPQLLVNDNEEAELISVREEPFSQTVQGTSTTQTSQGGVAEAGTTLTITPRISDAGMLNLEYSVELSSFVGASAGDGLQPPKQKENYRSIVTLPSDSTMVIGGLTTERLARSVSKVPFLGDIPIIGELFRSTSRQTSQSTIYVFIRPVSMRDANFGDLRLITQGPMADSGIADDPPGLTPARIPVHAGAITGRQRPLEPVASVRTDDDDAP